MSRPRVPGVAGPRTATPVLRSEPVGGGPDHLGAGTAGGNSDHHSISPARGGRHPPKGPDLKYQGDVGQSSDADPRLSPTARRSPILPPGPVSHGDVTRSAHRVSRWSKVRTQTRLPCSVRSMTLDHPSPASSVAARQRRSGLLPRCRCSATAIRPARRGIRKLHLDRSCEPLPLVRTAAVQGAHMGKPQQPFRDRCDPANTHGHRHLEGGRNVGSPTKPIRGDGEEQHRPAAERGATDEP